jgi:SAM-dependent methyltransferase
MHPTVLEFTERAVKSYGLNTPDTNVLIVGSLDVNGSVRPYFDRANVIGIDLFEGEGVDHIIDAHDLLGPYSLEQIYGYGNPVRPFDVVVCTEMLEHDDEFWTTLSNIGVLLRPGGYFILTARGARRGVEGKEHGESMWEHAYPDDYYRFMPNVVPKLLRLAGCDTLADKQDPYYPGFLALGKRT